MRSAYSTNVGPHSSPRCAAAWCRQATAPHLDGEPKRTSAGWQRLQDLVRAAIAALRRRRAPAVAMHRRTDLDEAEFAALCAQLAYSRNGAES